MARYDLDELKRRADLAALVAERSGPGKSSNAGRRVTFPCPNPAHSDAHPSFTVDTVRQLWRCWSQCNAGGDAIDLVAWLDGIDKGDAIEYLANRYRLEPISGKARRGPLPSFTPPPAPRRVRLVEQSTDTARPVHGDTAAQVLDAFLAARGWSRATAELVGLSVVRDERGTYRVRFPFLRDGVALLWQDRAAAPADAGPKWITPEGATLYPFGLDCLSRYDGDPSTWPWCPLAQVPAVWIVEGPADAVTLLEHLPSMSVLGLPGVSSWHEQYADAVAGVPVFVVADNDPAGDTLRDTLDESLAGRCDVVHVYVPEPSNDLGDWHLAAGRRFTDELEAATEHALTLYADALSVDAASVGGVR